MLIQMRNFQCHSQNETTSLHQACVDFPLIGAITLEYRVKPEPQGLWSEPNLPLPLKIIRTPFFPSYLLPLSTLNVARTADPGR